MDGGSRQILHHIKGLLEVSSQGSRVKPVGLDMCSSWGHIQGQGRERAGFKRLWSWGAWVA